MALIEYILIGTQPFIKTQNGLHLMSRDDGQSFVGPAVEISDSTRNIMQRTTPERAYALFDRDLAGFPPDDGD